MPETFALSPQGPYDLEHQRRFFGGWPAAGADPPAVAMAFPVEGWNGSAAVIVRQPEALRVTGAVHGVAGDDAERAWRQATSVLSLDVDGRAFPAVGRRDPAVERIAAPHGWMRPVLFHSPYEAACNFVIGQRISMAQARAIRLRMADESGDRVDAGGQVLAAFPLPQRLLELTVVRGLPAEKLERLHGIARAALEGLLDRARLRALDEQAALGELSRLRGVGPFSAQGILHRGAGTVDLIPDDAVTKQAVQRLYALDHMPTHDEVIARAQPWRPFRMWVVVLMHVWIRNEGGGAVRSRQGRGSRRS